MIRVASTGSYCLLALSLCGCTSFFTARAIESFTTELASGNLAGLESTTSTEFRQRALRATGSMESLKILPLPREEGEVTEVEEVAPDEQILTVQVGEPPQTVKYRLKREAVTPEKESSSWTVWQGQARRWVVDDVILTRERPAGQPPLTKSVTEQMDVLLTVQEFLASWSDGTRDETLALMHADLQDRMSTLSPVHLAQITGLVLDGLKDDSFRPEARIQTTHAVVLLPRRGGKLKLDLERSEDVDHRWIIRDVSVESTRPETPDVSVAHLAGCVGRASDFLKAYDSRDLDELKVLSSETFFTQALSTADFSTAPLPVPQLLASRFEIEEQDNRVDLLFSVGDDTYVLSMDRDELPDIVLPEQRTSEPLCRVDEVTIYERGGDQIKPLSVVFNAQAVVEVFAEALAERDLTMASQLSTLDLNQRVWSRIERPELMRTLPFDGIPAAPPRVVTTIFQGPVTEITVTQGTRALTYVLHSNGGRPQIDDVKYPTNNRSGSLKINLEALVPIYNFAWGWTRSDKAMLDRNSTDGVHRMVWMRTDRIPEIQAPIDQFLLSPAPKVEDVEGDRIVTFGTADHGMLVRLVNENDRFLVEDLHLVDAKLAGGRLEFINALRNWITIEESKPQKRTVIPVAAKPRKALASPLASLSLPQAAPNDDATTTVPPTEETPPVAEPTATPAPPAASPATADPKVPLLQQPIQIPGA
ncbi:MAG: hypothetical protein KDA75_02100 [Planctomycetaceae bacterium]|nr:hypothetical protein [Planctomycetaceae bacterium]